MKSNREFERFQSCRSEKEWEREWPCGKPNRMVQKTVKIILRRILIDVQASILFDDPAAHKIQYVFFVTGIYCPVLSRLVNRLDTFWYIRKNTYSKYFYTNYSVMYFKYFSKIFMFGVEHTRVTHFKMRFFLYCLFEIWAH